uniref:Uncharacterized protein n=1 Tax=Tanacetum cinerariifolium TaxID=118510 RepID=A0A6L2LIV4_TANCI|nr:hypothetical protein [Tanacetum cinerariifolium]
MFLFSHRDYVSRSQIGGLSPQRRMDPLMSLIHAFPVEEMYTPQLSDSFQENTDYSQEPNREESPAKAVATSSPKTKKPTKARQKGMIQSDDASRQIAWTHEEEIALTKDVVREIRRPMGMDKARDVEKNKGSRAPGSSSMNGESLARLMVTEMIAGEKEQRDAFI